FKTSDIISLHMRVTPQTKNMISKRYLSLMKPNSYLINTARADLIVKDDLVSALKAKQIAGAALDVSWVEPIPDEDPLLALDNVTLTPHIAGATVDAIPLSPFLLKNVVNDYLVKGYSDMLIK
ncbi:NAD(P)-dependent oxidoreductase, partial [Lacticaseibacillus paracasei]|uniref:NAD(P)-dependent oxidoreductase n=2 Tax=Lactobacillales TaxID=186826 RepID=UPI0034A0E513